MKSQSDNEKEIYIFLIHSGTVFSRIIRFATSGQYSHSAISIDGIDGPFYSFGRRNPNRPLPAGLVQEPMDWYFKHRKTSPCTVFRLPITQQQYDRMKDYLDSMYRDNQSYKYNLIGAMACFFHLPVRRKKHFFCSQFVARLLQDTKVIEMPKSPDLMKPCDFLSCYELENFMQGDISALNQLRATALSV